MSDLRSCAMFKTNLPDDAQWDQNDNLIQPGGLNLAEAICNGLTQHSVRPTKAQQHSFYGWAFEMEIEGVTIWAMLQFVEPWLLMTEVRRSGFFGWLSKKGTAQHLRAIG